MGIRSARAHVRSVNEKLQHKGYTDQQILDWWELRLLRKNPWKDKKKTNADSQQTTNH